VLYTLAQNVATEKVMRVFKFWHLAESTVLIDGAEKPISCFGGSNFSETDALADGQRRLEAVKRRIAGIDKAKGRGPDYEGDIREEPLKWIGDQDVVTRNRYGAEVLNTTSFVFVDIDEAARSIWQVFGRPPSRDQRKKAILQFLAKRFQKPDLKGLGIRVYETHSGVRLILGIQAMDPRSKESKKLLRSFNADRLYADLCAKQNCYRARLTPKPYRIKMKSLRLRYPYEEKDRVRIDEWTREYDAKSQGFSSCRLVQVLGNEIISPAIRLHDERTKAQSRLPLA
jgi:hypothetical protein